MVSNGSTVRLDFPSTLDVLDVVQAVSDHIGRMVGLDEEALHWMGVAVRESVINAVRHGNDHDEHKLVHVEFTPRESDSPPAVAISVRDEGPGFDPSTLSDCLAPENLLKSSGRGIFLIRSFMDEMVLEKASQGGMEMRMVKRAQAQTA